MSDSSAPKTLGTVLFPGFELLDVCGPLEMFGNLHGLVQCVTVAEQAGPVPSAQSTQLVAEYGFADCPPCHMLLVPGGIGTRDQVENPAMLAFLQDRAASAEIVMSVCTGSGLLAKAGLLDGFGATSNKAAFPWAVEQGPNVKWAAEARWVDDGSRVTSSGVTAGIDMALAVIARLFQPETAERLAQLTEYDWHRDPAWDPFARLYGLSTDPAAERAAFIEEHLGDAGPRDVMADSIGAFREAVAGLDAEALRRREGPGKWSILEVVSHMADAELVLSTRYRAMAARPGATLYVLDQDAWAAGLRYNDGTIEDALERFGALRNENLRLFQRLTPEQWKHHGMHPERGEEDMETTLRLYAAHDRCHLKQIGRIRATLGT